MIFVILLILLILFVSFYVIKKEFFDENVQTQLSVSNKYTIREITEATNTLLNSLNEPHFLVKVNYVKRTGAFISFNILAFNQQRYKMTNIFAKVKIPLSKTGTFTLIDSYISDSNEYIKNGVHSIKDSQTYGKVI